MKKILCIIITIAFIISAASCELADTEGGAYYFGFEINIEINENYISDTVPDSFELTVGGAVKDGMLYFDLDDGAKIFFDLLVATGIVAPAQKHLFDSHVRYGEGAYLCIGYDEAIGYIQDNEDKFTIKSSVMLNSVTEAPEIDENKVYYFSEIKPKIDRELLRLPGYRYSELYIIMNVGEDGASYINILATRENGKKEILPEARLEADVSDVLDEPVLLPIAFILPLRYLFELFGETVGWDAANTRAYVASQTGSIFFDQYLINSRTYISLVQVIAKTDYEIRHSDAEGGYIEIIISRN